MVEVVSTVPDSHFGEVETPIQIGAYPERSFRIVPAATAGAIDKRKGIRRVSIVHKTVLMTKKIAWPSSQSASVPQCGTAFWYVTSLFRRAGMPRGAHIFFELFQQGVLSGKLFYIADSKE